MKRLLALFLAILMVLSLVACGEKKDTSDAPKQENSNATPSASLDALFEAPTEEAKDVVDNENPVSEAPEQNEGTESTVSGIRPDFKEAMDSYEAFYTEYCEFLKKYSENPSDFTLLAKYAEMLAKAEEMDKAFEAWNESELSNEELKYYLDVNNRVMKMLVDVTG